MAERYPLLTSVTLPIIVIFLVTDLPVRALGELLTTARNTQDSDHGIVRSQDESAKRVRTID